MVTTTAAVHAAPKAESGLWSWITTVDHKRIGVLYGVTAFSFFLIGGLEAVFIRLQLARPENHFVSPDSLFGTAWITAAVVAISIPFASCRPTANSEGTRPAPTPGPEEAPA